MNSLVDVGETTSFSKTIAEADVAMFCAISGDFDPVHVDDEYARTTVFGRRIAHGIAVMGLLSAAESEMSRRIVGRGGEGKPVSLGYDGVRFIKPVHVCDTLKATYVISQIQADKARVIGKCKITNQHGDLVLVGSHIMKWV